MAGGAYARHGLAADPQAQAWMETAVLYALWHALALLAAVLLAERREGAGRALLRLAGGLFAAGIVLFSGSLVSLALAGAALLPMGAPAGGMALIAGWLCLAAAALFRGR